MSLISFKRMLAIRFIKTTCIKAVFSSLIVFLLIWYLHKFFNKSQKVKDGTIIIYNKIPKTGSTSFMHVAYNLSLHNKFNIIYMNTSYKRNYMSPIDQLYVSQNITKWIEKTPILYHGHFPYIDITRDGLLSQDQRIIYINIVRDPLKRFISYYYFLRYGDNYRPNLRRHKSGKNQTLDECIKAKDYNNCDLKFLWMQIPFFCGHYYFCREPGNAMALHMAKHNLATKYYLVGTTERLPDFLLILQHSLPKMFHGAHSILKSDGGLVWKRKTNYKPEPNQVTMNLIKESHIWKMEDEFYRFASDVFGDYFAMSQRYNFQPYDMQRVYQKIKMRT